MGLYGIFFVGTAKTHVGKGREAADWWLEKGEAGFKSLPGVISLRTLVSQFSLGGEYAIEFWYEIEDYGVLDSWDQAIVDTPEKYGPLLREFNEYFESGPSRLVGDWPASRLD